MKEYHLCYYVLTVGYRHFLKNWNSHFHHHLLYFLSFLSLPKIGLLHLISTEFYILLDNEICQAKDFLEYGYFSFLKNVCIQLLTQNNTNDTLSCNTFWHFFISCSILKYFLSEDRKCTNTEPQSKYSKTKGYVFGM